MTQARYQPVSASYTMSATNSVQIQDTQDIDNETMTNVPLSPPHTDIANSFEPPAADDDNEDIEASEQDRLVAEEPDPARFGIFVRPTTIARQIFNGQGTDGVFSNMSAKPEVGEEKEEHPPVCYTL